MFLDGERPTGNLSHWGRDAAVVAEVVLEQNRVDRGGHENDFERLASRLPIRQKSPEHHEGEIGVDVSLMGLVDDDMAKRIQCGLKRGLLLVRERTAFA